MARESEQVTLLRRKLGARRRRLSRSTAGLTQDQLAVAAFRHRTTIAHIEKGRLRADERFWTTADQVCGTDGALLAAYAEVQATKASEELKQYKAVLVDAQAQLDRLRSLDGMAERAASEERELANLEAALTENPNTRKSYVRCEEPKRADHREYRPRHVRARCVGSSRRSAGVADRDQPCAGRRARGVPQAAAEIARGSEADQVKGRTL